MRKFKFMQVDVFTRRPLEGNPCAVVFDADELTDAEMLAIAKEMNLSETAFIKRSRSCDFRAQYFTPNHEIPLAGHPTVATVHCLIESGRIDCRQLPKSISLELTAGAIRIDIERDSDGQSTTIIMYQMQPQFLRKYDPDEIMPIFNLTMADWLPDAPIQTVSTGTPMLMVPTVGLEALRRVELQIAQYVKCKDAGDFFSPHLFCLQAVAPGGTTFARHFSLPPDYEDPFTGSASGCMAAYLWHYRLIDTPSFIAQQGHWMSRPGQALLDVVGPPNAIETVKLSGTAVTTIIGELMMPDA